MSESYANKLSVSFWTDNNRARIWDWAKINKYSCSMRRWLMNVSDPICRSMSLCALLPCVNHVTSLEQNWIQMNCKWAFLQLTQQLRSCEKTAKTSANVIAFHLSRFHVSSTIIKFPASQEYSSTWRLAFPFTDEIRVGACICWCCCLLLMSLNLKALIPQVHKRTNQHETVNASLCYVIDLLRWCECLWQQSAVISSIGSRLEMTSKKTCKSGIAKHVMVAFNLFDESSDDKFRYFLCVV